MSNELDAHRLIAEVRKRPPLWDVRMAEYKDRTNTPHLWGEIAELLGVDVEQCKRKWKNLRDAYRAEVRRSDRRVARLKALGQYDPQRRGHSKWVYFEPMNFINESKRTSYAGAAANAAAAATAAGAENRRRTRSSMGPMEAEAEAEGEGEGNCGSAEDPIFVPGFHSFCDIKMETHHTTDDDVDGDEVDDEDEDDQLFEEFAAVATPQAARRLSDCIAANAAAAAAVAAEVNQTRASPTGTGIGSGNGSAARCKCSKRADEQVHFLEDLEREEQQLMQSTRKEITRANSVGHVGDADYNFLVSFLPQMKKMTELQNLQFRARMSELLLNTMSTPSPCAVAAAAAAARLGVVAVPKSMVQQQMASTVSSSQQLLPKEEEEREAIRTLTSRTQSQLRDLDDKML